MVKVVKGLMARAMEAGEDTHLALQAYRATPLNGQTPSPAEMLYSRKLRGLLPYKQCLTTNQQAIRDSVEAEVPPGRTLQSAGAYIRYTTETPRGEATDWPPKENMAAWYCNRHTPQGKCAQDIYSADGRRCALSEKSPISQACRYPSGWKEHDHTTGRWSPTIYWATRWAGGD